MKQINNAEARAFAATRVAENFAISSEQQYINNAEINGDTQLAGLLQRANSIVPSIARGSFLGNDISALEKEEAELLEKIEACLQKYGMKKSDLDFNPQCKNCCDTGIYMGRDCECYKKYMFEYIAKRLSGSDTKGGIGFENAKKILQTQPHLEKAYWYCEEFCNRYPDVTKRIIYLSGNTGSGKTYLAKVVLEELIAKGASGLFVSAFTLEDVFLKHFYNSTSYNPSQIAQEEYDMLFAVDVLVVDDLGTEIIHRKDMQSYFLNLIETRGQAEKLTIFTSNLKEESVVQRYGERFFSRLKGSSTAGITIVSDKDLREGV